MDSKATEDRNRFLRNMGVASSNAAHEFDARHPAAQLVIDHVFECVARIVYLMSGQSIKGIPHGHYVSGLIVSFARSQYVGVDLVRGGFLIESATLVRKQLELLGRLHELAAVGDGDIKHLLKRTPQLKGFKTKVPRLYGQLSEVAHAATAFPNELMGEVEVDGMEYSPVYPVYSHHALVSLYHIFHTTLEFHGWAADYLPKYYPNYDVPWSRRWLMECWPLIEGVFDIKLELEKDAR